MQLSNALKRVSSLSKLMQENEFGVDGSRSERDRLKTAIKQVKVIERKLTGLQVDSKRQSNAEIGKAVIETARENNVPYSKIEDAIVIYARQHNGENEHH